MTFNVLLSARAALRAPWKRAIEAALADRGLDCAVHDDPAAVAPADVRYLVFAPNGPVEDYTPYAGLRAMFSLWAGVEQALAIPTLPRDAPLCRMVEPGLTWGMRDYVVAHVMRHHMDLDGVLAWHGRGWSEPVPPLARDRTVGLLGLGALGGECARALAALGFDVAGWSRTPKSIPGVTCLHGEDGLNALLARSQILVGLLPATPATADLLTAERLSRLPDGAFIVNAGRGELIDDDALLAALDSGRIARATLDVFRVEPLPMDHPYRSHPRVTVTPHVASETRPATAAPEVAAQILRAERGEPLLHVVDRSLGY
jgi:glyoxylate/hydroxypyruvate reductase A